MPLYPLPNAIKSPADVLPTCMQRLLLLFAVLMVLHSSDVVLALFIVQDMCKGSPVVCLLCRYRPQLHVPSPSCARMLLARVDPDFLGANTLQLLL